MNEQETLKRLRAYIDQLLDASTPENPAWNIERQRSGKSNSWNYIDGCMITAVLALYEITGNERYINFAGGFMDYFVNADGSINGYDPKEYNLDNVNPAKNLFVLYDYTGAECYLRAMDTVRGQLETTPRTSAGNFWHKKIYPNQVWLDGLYMAQPFYMAYERRFNNMRGCRDSFTQFENVERLMRDHATGLYYHGYDESRRMYWADSTGLSRCFWLRSLGWLVMALVDTLEVMDEQMYYEYRTMQHYLADLVDAILPWQQPDGMFCQLIDCPQMTENYEETSGTAIIAYGIIKAVRLGLLPPKYRPFGEHAFYGTAQKYLSQGADGALHLGGICLVAGLGGDSHRDGSPQYYLSEPVVENEAKGVAPMLLCCTELLRDMSL
ncbi:MAG: glycoside hydrolase family 88 protein [Angelakisella sp.]